MTKLNKFAVKLGTSPVLSASMIMGPPPSLLSLQTLTKSVSLFVTARDTHLCTGMESVETATSSRLNSFEAAKSDITSKQASPSAANSFGVGILGVKQEVTSKVLGVEEEEGGLASELVRGEEQLLVAKQAGADKGRHLLTGQHLRKSGDFGSKI